MLRFFLFWLKIRLYFVLYFRNLGGIIKQTNKQINTKYLSRSYFRWILIKQSRVFRTGPFLSSVLAHLGKIHLVLLEKTKVQTG